MDYFKKIERSVTISADKRSTVDLQVDIWSQDLNVTKFILKLDTTDSATIDLTNATVRVAMVYNQDGQDVKIEAAGIVEDAATQKIAYVMSDRLAGFEGTVTAGFYVTLSTGQRIDIQNVTFNMRKSLLDKDLDVPTEDYYQTFDDIVADVRRTGDTAKSNINAVLPDVQSKVSAINTELAKIDKNMPDLFVAYADDLSGTGFSKSDTTKLYKGFSVKNSNLPTDYRWEVNPNNLKIVGDNLIVNGYGDFKNNTNFSNYILSGADTFKDKPSFKITTVSADKAINDNLIPIDINKAYEFSMNLKSLNGTPIYLGWSEYDIDGKKIGYENVTRSSTSTTTLARDLNNGDTVVYLTSASGWIDSIYNYDNGLIFWNYQDSTGYVYPEGVYSRNVWFDLYSRSDIDRANNIINLKKPWDKGKFKVGTKVSQSKAGNSYKYRNYENTSVPTEWTNTTFRIGEDRQLQSDYVVDYERFSPATKYIKFNAIWSYVNWGGDTYFINNVKLKCIDDKLLNSNPVNSILTTLSSENPSTTLGGTWAQLGTETKFDNTIYYWKRTN